jgi:hypothetical protein
MTDSDPDVRWMTYAEAAKALRANPESVAKRMRRNGWARRPGNDGKPRIAVPVDLLPPPPFVPDKVPDNAKRSTASVPDFVPDMNPDAERAARAEGEAAALREERDRLLRERDGERERAEEATRRLEEERSRVQAEAAKLREEAAGLATRAAVAEAEAKAQRDRAERAERPFWRRLIGQ